MTRIERCTLTRSPFAEASGFALRATPDESGDMPSPLKGEGIKRKDMKESAEERNEWERGEGETAKAYDAFREYRDLGSSRSLAKAAERVGKSGRLVKKWSRNHSWPARAQAYDEYMEKKRQGERKAARRDWE